MFNFYSWCLIWDFFLFLWFVLSSVGFCVRRSLCFFCCVVLRGIGVRLALGRVIKSFVLYLSACV